MELVENRHAFAVLTAAASNSTHARRVGRAVIRKRSESTKETKLRDVVQGWITYPDFAGE